VKLKAFWQLCAKLQPKYFVILNSSIMFNWFVAFLLQKVMWPHWSLRMTDWGHG